MEASGSSSCCDKKGKFCGMLFKILIVGLLTCMASSLWAIDKALGKIAFVDATSGAQR